MYGVIQKSNWSSLWPYIAIGVPFAAQSVKLLFDFLRFSPGEIDDRNICFRIHKKILLRNAVINRRRMTKSEVSAAVDTPISSFLFFRRICHSNYTTKYTFCLSDRSVCGINSVQSLQMRIFRVAEEMPYDILILCDLAFFNFIKLAFPGWCSCSWSNFHANVGRNYVMNPPLLRAFLAYSR